MHVVNRAFELFSVPGALSRVMHQSIHPHTLNQKAPGVGQRIACVVLFFLLLHCEFSAGEMSVNVRLGKHGRVMLNKTNLY